MTLRKTPTFWLELTVRSYPEGPPETDDTLRVSTAPLAFPTMIEGRVRPGGWSAIEYALSDWKGNPEASTFSAECDDTDGRLRAIAEAIGLTAYAKAEVSAFFLSEAGRKAGLAPRIVHRGYLQRAPKPLPNRKARIEAVDAASSHWFSLDPDAPLQKVFWTQEWLTHAGLINTPKEIFGKPVNIVIGEQSDVGQLDANGADASKGMVPPDYIGDRIVTSDQVITDVARAAYAFIGSDGNVSAGDEVTIGDVTYTFAVTANDPYEVKVGASSKASKDNLIAAINGSAGEGTLYGTGTEAHPDVSAAYHITVNPGWPDDDNVQVRFRGPGDDGNGTVVSADSPFGFFHEGGIPTGTMEGGTDAGPVTTDTIETIPPPVLIGERVGTAGTETYHYAVSMVTATGETLWSNVVTIEDSLPVGSWDASNYNRLTWTPPDGWADVYAERQIAVRIGGRSSNPPHTHLAILESAVVDEYHESGASEKFPAAPPVGTATVVKTTAGTVTTNAEWGLLITGLSFNQLIGIYGSDVAEGTAPARTLLDPNDPDLMSPLSANWPHTEPWIELNHPEGGTVRVSGFYAKGVLLQHHKDRVVTFAVNSCGVTETGDDTGRPITEASEAYIWVLNELALKNGGEGYRTGAFWPLETFADGTTVLNTTVIRVFQAKTVNFIGGRGYQFGRCFTQTITLNQFEQWFNRTFTCYTGQLENGQRGVWVIDDEADPLEWRHYRWRIEVPGPLAEPTIADDEVENHIAFRYDWDADAQAFRVEVETIQHLDSQKIYGKRMAAPKDEFLELNCTRDAATARDAMQRRLLHNKVAPLYQPLDTSLMGIEQSLGTGLRLTHPDGTGVNGYQNRPFFTTRKRIGTNGPHHRVTLTARDLYRFLSTSFPLLQDETTQASVAPAWSATASYSWHALVTHDGKTWIAAQTPAIGDEPGVDESWDEVSASDDGWFVLGDETSAFPPPVGAYELR